MAITFTTGPIVAANVNTVRNEINRLRQKHSLATFTFTALDAYPRASTMTELRAQISAIDQSGWIPDGSIDVSGIPTFAVGQLIKMTDLTAMSTVLANVDAICANNTNYSNNSNYGDYSNNPNYSDFPNNPNNSNNSANSKPGV